MLFFSAGENEETYGAVTAYIRVGIRVRVNTVTVRIGLGLGKIISSFQGGSLSFQKKF